MLKRHFCWCLGLLMSMALLAGCGRRAFQVQMISSKQQLKETQIRKDKGAFISDKIAVIDVDGVLANARKGGFMRAGENPVSLFVEKLDKAATDKKVKAVVLRINSPGGTVAASDIMHHRLVEFKRKTGKPVVACVLGLGASGAYYLACGADGIMIQPSGVTGSIGTVFQTFSVAGTMKKIGVKTVAIKSGELKDLASPLHDLRDDERQVLQGVIDELYEQFLVVVREGRRNLDDDEIRRLADGRVFTARQAQEEGLVDKVGYLTGGIEWAKQMAGVDRVKVVIYRRPMSYKPNAYGSASSDLGGLGALVNVELPDWLALGESQFLYLWQPAAD